MMDIAELVASIPELSGVKHYELLNRGVVNQTWRLFDGAHSFVLRQDTSMVATLGLDRSAEIDVLEVAAETGLGPAVIWADPDAGLLLTEYIEGHSWNEANLGNNQNLARLAKLLQRMHSVSVGSSSLKSVDLPEYAWRYARRLATPEAERLAIEVVSLVDEWASDHSRHVLCHNDLVCSNIIDPGHSGNLMLIDWEYAGHGEPCFDLAVFIQHHSLSVAASRVFLDAYDMPVDEQRLEGCMGVYDRVLVLWLMLVCSHSDAPQSLRVALDSVSSRLNH